jgi:hypothetical protein
MTCSCGTHKYNEERRGDTKREREMKKRQYSINPSERHYRKDNLKVIFSMKVSLVLYVVYFLHRSFYMYLV